VNNETVGALPAAAAAAHTGGRGDTGVVWVDETMAGQLFHAEL